MSERQNAEYNYYRETESNSWPSDTMHGEFSVGRAEAMERVAEEMGYPFRVLAREGDPNPYIGGHVVRPGRVQLSIDGGEKGLGEFWGRVDEICPPEEG